MLESLAFWLQFHAGDRLPKLGGPGVKVRQSQFFQQVSLQVPLHGVQLRHGVGHRGTCGEHHALAPGELVHVLALHVQVGGFQGFRLGDAPHIPHFGVEVEVFEQIRLVNEQPVYTQFLEGHHIVLGALVVELFQLGLQTLLRPLHLLHGEPGTLLFFGGLDALHHLCDLLFQHGLLPLCGEGDFLKLAVAQDDPIVVSCGDAGAEFLPALLLKVLLSGHQDIGSRIQVQKV